MQGIPISQAINCVLPTDPHVGWPEGAGGGEDTRGSCCVVVVGVVVLTQIINRTVFDPQVNFVCQKYIEDEVASDQ